MKAIDVCRAAKVYFAEIRKILNYPALRGLIQTYGGRIMIVRGMFLLLLLAFSTAHGKELTNRLGVGFQNQFSIDLPGVAARYYPNPDLGVSAALGIDTENNASKFGLMVKAFRVIFKEPNLNFYLGASAALISEEVNAVSDSGFELNGFVGVEFFMPGLESLSFITEAGIGIASISDGVRFRTFGDHPLRGGIIFYF